MPKRRHRRRSDAFLIRFRGLLYFTGAMLPEFISALSVENAKINWPLVCCKASLGGIIALGAYIDQTRSKGNDSPPQPDSPSNNEAG